MVTKKIKWEKVIAQFDNFEEKFSKDSDDASLPEFFQNFEDTVNHGRFDNKQLKIIHSKLQKLRDLFAQKKGEIKKISTESLTRHEQVSRYLKNSNYKK
jgi:hypothetical protein